MFSKKIIVAGISAVFLATGSAWAAATTDPQESLDLSRLEGTIPINHVADVQSGYPVSLSGVVVSKPGGGFMLEDATGSVALDIPAARWTGYLNEPGTTFDVFGTVKRNAADHSLVVAAQNLSVHES